MIFRGEIYITEPLGSDLIVDVTLGKERVKIKTVATFKGDRLDPVFMSISPENIHLFDAETTLSLM